MYRIKEKRLEMKMSQDELSQKANVSRAIISKSENDEEVVTSTETLKKLASALNCKVSEIFLA